MTAADIIAAAHAKFAERAAAEFAERVEWLARTTGEPPGRPMVLPSTFSATTAVDYILRYYAGWKRAFGSKRALRTALLADNPVTAHGSFSVPYDAGRASASGFPLHRPVGYGKYRRTDIDAWVGDVLSKVGT